MLKRWVNILFRCLRLSDERNPPSRKFTDPIRKQKLKTFSSMTTTKKTVTVSGRETILRATCNLFGTMVLANQSRDLNIKQVLSHPLGPILWVLATPEGLRTTSKSTLANDLIKLSTTTEEIPRPSATVIDGTAIVQKVNGNKKTLEDNFECCAGHCSCRGRSKCPH